MASLTTSASNNVDLTTVINTKLYINDYTVALTSIKDGYQLTVIKGNNTQIARILTLSESEIENIRGEEEKRVAAEALRIVRENERQAAETTRVSNEEVRISNETTRESNEETRQNNEATRISNEESRVTSEENRAEVEESRATAETNRDKAETSRISAENTREANEEIRASNEQKRLKNEETREANEAERKQYESARIAAEGSRANAENTRKQNEAERVANEESRTNNENIRKANETTREQNEVYRQTNENSRYSSEQTRVSNETKRQTAEETRVSNESARQTQESTRESNETTRQNNESTRQSNEATRQSNEESRETKIKLVSEMTVDAETISESEDASVDKTIVDGHYNLDFKIPQGKTGTPIVSDTEPEDTSRIWIDTNDVPADETVLHFDKVQDLTETEQETAQKNIGLSNVKEEIDGLAESKQDTLTDADKQAIADMHEDTVKSVNSLTGDVVLTIPEVGSEWKGLMLDGSNQLRTVAADAAYIDGRASANRIIAPSNIDYAVKAALTDSKRDTTYTDDEKANACDTIGAYCPTKEWVLKGTLTETVTSVTADLTGCTELLISGTGTATNNVTIYAKMESQYPNFIYYAFSSSNNQVLGHWKDIGDGFECVSCRNGNGGVVYNLLAYGDLSHHISEITLFGIISGNVQYLTTADIKIYAR